MALQNRVTPFGQLEFSDSRGTYMGNRGILHNENKEIVAPWRHKNRVICQLSFKGRKRTLFGDRTYSELFFLDEATALAAGHRPCFTCRRERYKEFKDLWARANAARLEINDPAIDQIDNQLHRERAIRGGGKMSFTKEIETLPSGTMINWEGRAHLLWDKKLYPWTHSGYRSGKACRPEVTLVEVLTPKSIVEMYRAGFVPEVHSSLFTHV